MTTKFEEKLKEYSEKVVKVTFTNKLFNLIPEL